MNLITAGSKKGRIRHYVDTDKYNRLSTCKALCGKDGRHLVNYNAVFFNYEFVFPKMCKKCLALSK